jgi:hypothetical protein
MGDNPTRLGLSQPFLNFRQKTETFDGIVEGCVVGQVLECLDGSLLLALSSHARILALDLKA